MKALLVISVLIIALGDYHSITAQRIGPFRGGETINLPVKLSKPS